MKGPEHKRVLFVCVGNCCRSQMAEGFATHHGSDVMMASSAGLAPAGVVVDPTVRAMSQKNIDISSQYSKAFRLDEANDSDLVVNMSGYDLPRGVCVPVVEAGGTQEMAYAARFAFLKKWNARSSPATAGCDHLASLAAKQVRSAKTGCDAKRGK